ncbi:cobalt-precorrin-6A reductase [Chenggangzhangella methanolivorans]|uniref:Cobalt-precorrin-6A reductase n=1 Tax=Chenggangzhangella methanolivorans TaxID=1437009 RepID=A0A9E6UL54_9HYPH|nr:cobalt-precorrin-6A reductase [Chenggangzhangella methanolivorans]QZO00137.1 cobalt-precorrin-6A reductase [Chenggangzhangella methanolivorans]
MTPLAAPHNPTFEGEAAPRVLILGGSSDGFEAAERFTASGYEVVTSFAGRTETRRTPAGLWRVGGFGGVTGLSAYLAVEDFALVVDATHPFAARIKDNAAKACHAVGARLVHVVRPAWRPREGDDWRFASDVEAAAQLTPRTDGPCFLTVGRMKIAPFAKRRDLRFVIRTVEPPEPPFDHPNAIVVNDRGPFSLANEHALFEEHGFGVLVTANSGGKGAVAKLDAARERGVPVVLVDRPPPPAGLVVETVEEALEQAKALIGDPGVA